MTGYVALLRKELMEIIRTWKIWVLPGILLGLAVISPLTARFQRELMGSVLNESGLVVALPDPTWLDALIQWNKSLSQIGLIVVILISGSMISSEARQGTQVLILTKPVSRQAYVLAKYTAQMIFVGIVTIVAATVEIALATALFPETQVGVALQLTGVWLLLALVLLAFTLVGSAGSDNALVAAGIALAAMLVLLLLGLWGPATRYTPAGLYSMMSRLAAGAEAGPLGPVWAAVAVIAGCVTGAAAIMVHREL